MGRQCHELLQALLNNAKHDEKSRVMILLRSIGATWTISANGATTIVLDEDAKKDIPLICRPCSWIGQESKVRAFVTDPMSIVFCTGRCEVDLESILVHELTHLFDLRNLHLNLRDCNDLAYSEIRAAKFAECYGIVNPDLAEKCIRRRAVAATTTALNQVPEQVVRLCIEDSYNPAMRDNRPFD